MRRVVRRAALGCVFLSMVACKGGDEAGTSPSSEVAAEQAKLSEGEDDLLARRDMLLSARKRIRSERTRISEERRLLIEQGGDPSALDAREGELLAEEQALVGEEQQLNDRLGEYLADRRKLMAQLAGENQAAARESLMAAREKDMARREERLAERETQLASREALLAKREKETCGAVAPTIIQTGPAPGTQYTRADVEPMLKRARQEMSRKGILSSDLPGPVQGLEDEATRAMAKADWGKAHFAADQLVRSVRGLSIDKAFIAAKIGRLNQVIKGKKLDGSKEAEVSKLFREATADFGDGQFQSANGRLNRIYGLIR